MDINNQTSKENYSQ